MDSQTKWSEHFTDKTVASRKPTAFGSLLESQGLREKLFVTPCVNVHLGVDVSVQQYQPQDDCVLQPAPSTAKGLAQLLNEKPTKQNYLRDFGLSSMTVPLSLPVVFDHKPTLTAMVGNLEDSLTATKQLTPCYSRMLHARSYSNPDIQRASCLWNVLQDLLLLLLPRHQTELRTIRQWGSS